ncbi:hypothetical protein [Streptacidiphilus albus]|uniref:hypothetical protein n=1 Tax=Streptacidiphilus albus TaxID=105425 RepID=UPI00054BCC12|nr:hypothetical protein [Streptacidiphilus albus]
MGAELAELASSGATTLVGLLVSDSWEQVKQRVGALFARGRSEQAATEELELSRAELIAAREAGDTGTAADAEAAWRVQLRRVLLADPAAVAELEALLREIGPPQPEAAGGSLHNSITGPVRNSTVVQARDTRIGSIGPPPARDRRP